MCDDMNLHGNRPAPRDDGADRPLNPERRRALLNGLFGAGDAAGLRALATGVP